MVIRCKYRRNVLIYIFQHQYTAIYSSRVKKNLRNRFWPEGGTKDERRRSSGEAPFSERLEFQVSWEIPSLQNLESYSSSGPNKMILYDISWISFSDLSIEKKSRNWKLRIFRENSKNKKKITEKNEEWRQIHPKLKRQKVKSEKNNYQLIISDICASHCATASFLFLNSW